MDSLLKTNGYQCLLIKCFMIVSETSDCFGFGCLFSCSSSFSMSTTTKERSSQRLRAKLRSFSARKLTSLIRKVLDKLAQFIGELNKRGKLHGIDHLVNKNYHPLERFLWLSLVLAAFYGVFYIGNTQFERYRANPTVISLERGALPVQP
jgi:hypothetical protein